MRFRRTNARTVAADLRRLADWLQGLDEEYSLEIRADVARWLNSKLDEILAQDAFGTEGQWDPRGDHRA